MKKIRIGKDFKIVWTITTNGENVSLDGRDLRLEMKHFQGEPKVVDFHTEGNIVYAFLRGREQEQLGSYNLTLWENYDKNGQNVVDSVNAFKLVQDTSCEGGVSDCHNLDFEVVDLGTSDLQLAGIDGVTPKLKTEDDYWYVSYDYGKTWEKLGKCVGRDGSILYPKFSVNSEMELEMDAETPTDRVEYDSNTGELILNI